MQLGCFLKAIRTWSSYHRHFLKTSTSLFDLALFTDLLVSNAMAKVMAEVSNPSPSIHKYISKPRRHNGTKEE